MSNIQTGAERMPHDLSHLGFLAGQIGRLITISTTPVIAGDSFEMDAVGALRLSPLRRGRAIESTVDICTFYVLPSRGRHTRFDCDWSSGVCSSDLWSPYVPASHSAKPTAACLVTVYGASPTAVSRPAAEQVWSRYPSPRASIGGSAARAAYTWASTLTAQVRCQVSSPASTPSPVRIPALEQNRSSCPNRLTAPSTRTAISPPSLTSTATPTAVTPDSDSATAATASPFRPASTSA